MEPKLPKEGEERVDVFLGCKVRIDGHDIQVGKRIRSGVFGDVYAGVDETAGIDVAIKVEKVRDTEPAPDPVAVSAVPKLKVDLSWEARLLRRLDGIVGIPKLYWYSGVCTNPAGELIPEQRMMVIERLGADIGHVFRTNKRHLSERTLCVLAIQTLRILKEVHAKGIIHRDVKPDNLMVGMASKANTVYLVDFGLSKFFVHPRTNTHIPYRDDKTTVTGTPRYASINTHMGIEQSRRDDIESLAYALIYLWRGNLPWQSLNATTKTEMHRVILECKLGTPVSELCDGMPAKFSFLLEYSRRLKFYDEPEYDKLIDLFSEGVIVPDASDTSFEWHRTIQRSKLFKK